MVRQQPSGGPARGSTGRSRDRRHFPRIRGSNGVAAAACPWRAAIPAELIAVIEDLTADPMSRMAQHELADRLQVERTRLFACSRRPPARHFAGSSNGRGCSTQPGKSLRANSSERRPWTQALPTRPISPGRFARLSGLHHQRRSPGLRKLGLFDPTPPAMIRAARPNEIALLPQIENAADERYVRVGLPRILAMPPPASPRSSVVGATAACGSRRRPSTGSWASR